MVETNKYVMPIVLLVIGLLVGFYLGSSGILGQAFFGGPMPLKKTITLYVGDSMSLTDKTTGAMYNLKLTGVIEDFTGGTYSALFELYGSHGLLIDTQSIKEDKTLQGQFNADGNPLYFKEDPYLKDAGRDTNTNIGYAIIEYIPVPHTISNTSPSKLR